MLEKVTGKTIAWEPKKHYSTQQKEEKILKASCALEDSVYNLMRPHKTLQIEIDNDKRRWMSRSPAMAAGLTDHIWTMSELMMTVAVPNSTT